MQTNVVPLMNSRYPLLFYGQLNQPPAPLIPSSSHACRLPSLKLGLQFLILAQILDRSRSGADSQARLVIPNVVDDDRRGAVGRRDRRILDDPVEAGVLVVELLPRLDRGVNLALRDLQVVQKVLLKLLHLLSLIVVRRAESGLEVRRRERRRVIIEIQSCHQFRDLPRRHVALGLSHKMKRQLGSLGRRWVDVAVEELHHVGLGELLDDGNVSLRC